MMEVMGAIVDNEEVLSMFADVAQQFESTLFEKDEEPPPSADAKSRVPPIPISQVQNRYPVQSSQPSVPAPDAQPGIEPASLSTEVVEPTGVVPAAPESFPAAPESSVPTDKDDSVVVSQEADSGERQLVGEQPPVQQPPVQQPPVQEQYVQQPPVQQQYVQQPPAQV